MRSVVLVLLLVAGCSPFARPCQVTAGGACATDADCVLARCADASCSCGYGACGAAVPRSQVGTVHACLVAVGDPTPAGCKSTGPECGCPAFDCHGIAAACRQGSCAAVWPDGGPFP